MVDLSGRQNDQYEVLELIGRGSFGQIHKVRRKSDGLILARKEIAYNRMTQKEIEQLCAEFSILSKLKHQNIVQYYSRDHNKADQSLYIYMEYCGGGDLSHQIKRCKANGTLVPENIVWSIFTQIILALYRCHHGADPPTLEEMVEGWDRKKHNVVTTAVDGTDGTQISGREVVVHRDLKPENIFLDHETCVKLGDFGLSKILASDQHMATTYVGTPYYMSPEIVADLPYTSRSDIWSLGCLMYELCTLKPPFDAKSHLGLAQKIRLGKYDPLPRSYSPELRRVIDSCLQVNANDRPDTAMLLDLQIIRTIRRELEAVEIRKILKQREEELNKQEKELEEARLKIAKILEERSAHARIEIDNELRQMWEKKAQDEIDRQIKIRTTETEQRLTKQYLEAVENMRSQFQGELEKQVQEEVEKRFQEELLSRGINGLGVSVSDDESSKENEFASKTQSASEDNVPTIVKSSSMDDLFNMGKAEYIAPASPMDISMVSPMQPNTFHRRQQPSSPTLLRNIGRKPGMTRATSMGGFGGLSTLSSLQDSDDEEDIAPIIPTHLRAAPISRPSFGRQESAPIGPRTGLSRVFSAPMNHNGASDPVAQPRARRISTGKLKPNAAAENQALPSNRKLTFGQQPISNKFNGGVGVKVATLNHTKAKTTIENSGKSIVQINKEMNKEKARKEKENTQVPVWDVNTTPADDLPSPFKKDNVLRY